MNIFVLDESPVLSAQWQHDRHVVKMILESCQMLSAAVRERSDWYEQYESCTLPNKPELYKLTHVNHPCNAWVRSSEQNFVWLTIHLHALLTEYRKRFPAKTHKCERMFYLFAEISARLAMLPHERTGKAHRNAGFLQAADVVNIQFVKWALVGRTQFVYCGPTQYKPGEAWSNADEVTESYQRYYLAEKVSGNRWTNHAGLSLPNWLADKAVIFNRPDKSKSRATRKPRQPRAYVPYRMSNPNGKVSKGLGFLRR